MQRMLSRSLHGFRSAISRRCDHFEFMTRLTPDQCRQRIKKEFPYRGTTADRDFCVRRSFQTVHSLYAEGSFVPAGEYTRIEMDIRPIRALPPEFVVWPVVAIVFFLQGG